MKTKLYHWLIAPTLLIKVEEKDAKIRELESRLEKLEQLVNSKTGETK